MGTAVGTAGETAENTAPSVGFRRETAGLPQNCGYLGHCCGQTAVEDNVVGNPCVEENVVGNSGFEENAVGNFQDAAEDKTVQDSAVGQTALSHAEG